MKDNLNSLKKTQLVSLVRGLRQIRAENSAALESIENELAAARATQGMDTQLAVVLPAVTFAAGVLVGYLA